ncbi:MAG: aminodeoxychorismate/anthranilate synthase component II [Desulfuromonadales bacterium]|uniref:anthranilate synthase component II n=1 Tax=Desulfuromonas sp. KJ2020 TaxID=2919173 RepID=UPI0020A703FE|nr:aminodeoxychorismate/anthranilate synthase component II [Desulfuromonas sp. KJ2020]MCP3177145.1 aminodeoxychorismate/anthranilate synthase component II [Desulfuromonas sp. KJ2020]
MLLMLDNYDSFTYNLVQYLQELGAEVVVRRNDQITVQEIAALKPRRIVISPGPCSPTEAGISVELIKTLSDSIPMLGVCLGHQSIGYAFGGKVVRATELMHGKTSLIRHDNSGVFAGLSNPFVATRYHSLIVERESLPDCLRVTAWVDDGTIMGLEHRQRPLWGVQFHPESILTAEGKTLLANFLKMT